jgi:dipeptidyl aminopeptidase/acylaminoacyl peptidase
VPEPYRQASPIAFVSADDPPMLFYHGGMDWVVSDINATRMREALQPVGVPVETYIVHGVGHVGAFFNRGAINAGIDFLQRHLR